MKYIYVVFVVLFTSIILNAQQYVVEWVDTLNNGYTEFAYALVVDHIGNVYVTGSSMIPPTGNDYFTVKYDSGGNIIWADTIDNGSDDVAYGIAVDNIGNVYVTGGSEIGADDDFLTVKYDSSGSILWADTIDHGGSEYAYGITVDNLDNIYITGHSNYDYFTVKYDSGGNILWADTLDNGSNECAYNVAVDDIGNIYVTGYAHGAFYDNWFTVKYDSGGSILWADTIYKDGNDIAYGIAVDDIGNVYVTGRSWIGSNYDYLTVKYDTGGNIIWADTLDYGNLDIAYGIALDDIGNIFVTGISYIGTTYDFLTVKYDTLGSIVWADTINSGDYDGAYAVTVDSSGSIYVTGIFYYDYLTAKYLKFKDAGTLSILSPPDTVSVDSGYTPSILVKNNSYETTLDFDVSAFIDSAGSYIYSDTQTVNNLLPSDSTIVNFNIWTTPSNPIDLVSSFYIITPDMNPDNDTISKSLYVRDLIAPVIDSAVAFDGTNPGNGIDDDDYVILYFSEPTNIPTIDNTNINSVLSLSGGHSWLDGFDAVGVCDWNLSGTQFLINLTTNISLPTVAVGDTITPDSITITDVNGNPCFQSVILGGSFDPMGIGNDSVPDRILLNVSAINRNGITFSYGITDNCPHTVTLYSIDGRVIKKIEGKESGYYKGRIYNLLSGVYFLRLNHRDEVISRKVVLVR